MAEYYLDIETTGLDPRRDKIITVQYQRLGAISGRIEGELVILKEWEIGEEGVLRSFLDTFIGGGDFDFVPIGFNIPFIFAFLRERAWLQLQKKISANWLFGKKPYLDLKPVLVILNKGSFKGANLELVAELKCPGERIPQLYEERRYAEIEEAIRDEAEKFIWFYQKVKALLPPVLDKIKMR
ncbi:MAG: hypothetical protein DRN35_00035 [Thermoplasmata archaeon]|nr:MAG: hypothetical protein DRN35_00035 [Thermoplasmata archaeon]RLF75821.1 MAG: hypothetical protein DRN42_02200 [Thermoplasmata archaeon]